MFLGKDEKEMGEVVAVFAMVVSWKERGPRDGQRAQRGCGTFSEGGRSLAGCSSLLPAQAPLPLLLFFGKLMHCLCLSCCLQI